MGLFATPLTWAERWLMLIAAFAVVFAAGVVGGIHYEGTVRDARDARQEQVQLQAQVAATQHTLDQEHRLQDAAKEVANDAQMQADQYRADLADAHAVGQRLSRQLAACGERRAASAAAPAASATADPADSVFADVQRRLAEAEDATVEFADASRRAGLACERIHDSMTP